MLKAVTTKPFRYLTSILSYKTKITAVQIFFKVLGSLLLFNEANFKMK